MMTEDVVFFFFFNDTATTEIYTLSLHDALPISEMKLLADQAKAATGQVRGILGEIQRGINTSVMLTEEAVKRAAAGKTRRSEEHTSELQSRQYLVCRLLLEKKTQNNGRPYRTTL